MEEELRKNKQKGISIYLSLMIMLILLSVALGMSTIIVSQIKMIHGIRDSIIAFSAANSGIEEVLYKDRLCRQGVPGCGAECIAGCNDGLAENKVVGITGTIDIINGITVTATYKATFNAGALDITSVGSFKGTKRAVEVLR